MASSRYTATRCSTGSCKATNHWSKDMAQQDEVSGLRDIIRHDVMMDAKALEKLHEVKTLLTQLVHIDHTEKRAAIERMRLADDNRLATLITLLDEIESCLNSTLADAQKNPGIALTLGPVES